MIPPLPEQRIDPSLPIGRCRHCEGCGDDVAWTEGLPSTGKRLWCSWECYHDTDGMTLAPELREGLVKYFASNA